MRISSLIKWNSIQFYNYVYENIYIIKKLAKTDIYIHNYILPINIYTCVHVIICSFHFNSE